MVPLNRKEGKGKDNTYSFIIAQVLGPARKRLHPIGDPQMAEE